MDKLICVGKNYAEHAVEMSRIAGDSVASGPGGIPAAPVLFLKPPSVVHSAAAGQLLTLPFPRDRGSLHHECEIVARVAPDRASLDAVTLGLDMTLRDEQTRLKKASQPWELSKVFAGSAVLGPWIPLEQFPDYLDAPFSFWLEGQLRQEGTGRQMRLAPLECLRQAARYFPLVAGDALFTGTPAGVGPVEVGQTGELRWGTRLRYSVKWV